MQPYLSEGATPRLSVIEVLRGVAALAVVLFHAATPFSSDSALFLQRYGWLGVDVFFVISGFVIPLSLHGKGYRIIDFPRFLLRRLVRLEPPYLISIVLGITLWHLSTLAPGFRGQDVSYSMPQLAAHLLYLVPLTNYQWLSPVYWSLAYEFLFYILVGLLYPVLAPLRSGFTAAAVVLIGAGFFALTGFVNVHILEFAVGVLSMRFLMLRRRDPTAILWLVAALSSLLLLDPVRGVIACSTTVAILALCKHTFGGWPVTLGGISYSLYLTHVPIVGRITNLMQRFDGGGLYEALAMALATLASLVFALVFVRFVERPALQASRSIPNRAA
jgi:peptidoglycan/LPS O-acetylase OafA/YrhL